MAVPADPLARRYYRAALERLADADALLNSTDRTTASVYLGGYAVEFILKALIVSQAKPALREAVVAEFRGTKAHSFQWLRERYSKAGGPTVPSHVAAAFTAIGTWAVDIRYNPISISPADAKSFRAGVQVVFDWAKGRL